MQTEHAPAPHRDDHDPVFKKLSNIEGILEKQVTERRGSARAATVALFAAVMYFGSPSYFPDAGKEQRPIAVEFTSMALNQSALQNAYNQNLQQLFAGLPDSRAPELKFTSNAAELTSKIILVNANVLNSARLSLSASAFLPTLQKDFDAQILAGALSAEQISALQQTLKTLNQTVTELSTCKTNLDKESATYRAAMTNNAAPNVQAESLIQLTNTVVSLVRNQSGAMKCMQMVDQVTTSFPQLAEIHDAGIVEYNKRAEQDARWLALVRTIAGLLLFFVGNSTRSFIQYHWLKRIAKKNKKD